MSDERLLGVCSISAFGQEERRVFVGLRVTTRLPDPELNNLHERRLVCRFSECRRDRERGGEVPVKER